MTITLANLNPAVATPMITGSMKRTSRLDAVVLRRGDGAIATSGSNALAVTSVESGLFVVVAARFAFQRVDPAATRINCCYIVIIIINIVHVA